MTPLAQEEEEEHLTESAKQKKNKTSKEKDAGWKRSRKMNTLLVPGARSAVVKGRGRSAAQFVLKSK